MRSIQGKFETIDSKSKSSKLTILLIVFITLFILSVSSLLFVLNWEIQIDTSDVVTQIEYGEQPIKPVAHVKGKLFFKDGFECDVETATNSDFSTIGLHRIHYKAQWMMYQSADYQDIVIIDTKKPTIEFNDDGTYKATDNYDGDLTEQVQQLVEGNVIIYLVSDSSGNQTTAEVTFQINNDAPTIELIGEYHTVIQKNKPFVDPWVKAEDTEDGDLSNAVTVIGDVDVTKIGTYEIQYTVLDSNKVEATITRVVHVVENYVNNGKNMPIYLTFDDGPSQYTEKLLDVLDKYQIKATFFVVGKMCNESALKSIVDRGHSIGMHSMNHSYKEIYSSEEAFMQDLRRTQSLIKEYTGVETMLFRFPGGSSNTVSSDHNKGIMTRLAKIVQDEGFAYFDWNVSSGDAGGATTAEAVYKNTISGIKRQSEYAIVLQHDIKRFSVDAVEDIIIWGLENGYRFEKLTTESPTAHHGINN